MSSAQYAFSGPSGSVTFTWAPHRDEPLRVARDFDAAAAALEDEYKMLVAAREVVVADIKSHFVAAEGPDGGWPDLAGTLQDVPEFEFIQGQGYVQKETINTAYSSGAGGPSHLTQTGEGRAGATAREAYRIEADGHGGTITFDAMPPHYMMAHNKGLPERQTALPQREWLWLSEGAAQGVFRIFEDFVDDAVAIVMNPLTGGAEIRTTGGFFQSPTAFYG